MIKRTVEISNPSYLSSRLGQLVIKQQEEKTAQIPFEDLGVLILAHPQITVTQAVICACGEHNIALIHCGQSHVPISLTLPLSGHSLHSKILSQQIAITPVRRKQLWQQIITTKIREQALTLKKTGNQHQPVTNLIKKVKSGDSENTEAQAAQRYWKLLFDDSFRRNPDMDGINSLLNYGYAVIRASVARALVATGFHPGIGLNHSNQYNAYCLADDIMEPFRPWVDEVTYGLELTELNQETKASYLQLLAQSVDYEGKTMPFMVALGQMSAKLKDAYSDKQMDMSFPVRI